MCRRSRVEHRDRLAGFGVVEALLSVPCRSLLVLTDDGVVNDVVRQMTEKMTALCARRRGRRGARRSVVAAVSAAVGLA